MNAHATTDLAPYTCFTCRRTFKRSFEQDMFYRKCPHCGAPALRMDIRFRPPKKSDHKQWAKVRYLVEHGFVYQKVYRKEGELWLRENYPDNLEQAREFVLQFKDQALPIPKPR